MASILSANLFANIALAGDRYIVHNSALASGGGIVQADCFRLVGTIGEAVAGTTSRAGYRLTSGFPATLTTGASGQPPDGGIVFSDGFDGDGQAGNPDGNSGACTP